MNERTNDALPVIAVAMGDPSGISPELTARILSEADLRGAARYVVFGDKRLLDLGIKDGGVDPQVSVVKDGDALPLGDRPVFVDLANHDPADLKRGTATLAGGKANQLGMLVVLGVNGTPFFIPVYTTTFDGSGEIALSLTVPIGLTGLDVDLGGVGIVPSGKARFSEVVTLEFN